MTTSKLPWWRSISEKFGRFALGGFAILLIINLVRSVENNYSISRQIRSLHDQVNQVKDDQAFIAEQNNYYKTDTYKEIQARLRLGYVKPGEKMVIVPENRNAASAKTGVASAVSSINEARKNWDEQPPYMQWYLLFFGSQSLLEETFGS